MHEITTFADRIISLYVLAGVRPTLVFDIDGTLVEHNDAEDVIKDTCTLLRKYVKKLPVLLCTARPESLRTETEKMLRARSLDGYTSLIMRSSHERNVEAFKTREINLWRDSFHPAPCLRFGDNIWDIVSMPCDRYIERFQASCNARCVLGELYIGILLPVESERQ